jgi:hypothetical protein
LRIASAEPERMRIVDASLSVEEIHARVLEIVVPFLESRGQWAATKAPQKSPPPASRP